MSSEKEIIAGVGCGSLKAEREARLIEDDVS
jgi:hypothetical protein